MRVQIFRACAAVALATVSAATLGGCNRQPDGVVHVTVIGDSIQLADPRLGPLSAPDAVLVSNAAQGLVRFDARGQIVGGLAEAWNVSDDGLSYIFRLANTSWSDGRKVTAEQVARLLRRLIARSSRDPLKDSFGAVDEIVAMTDRVIEIQLKQPRPHLLQLLAQPEMGLVSSGVGTGPFTIDKAKSANGALRLTRSVPTPDEEVAEKEELDLRSATAAKAIEAFLAGDTDLVTGGTFADLPLAQRADPPRRALRFDPASGLFGLVPARPAGPLADPEVRQLLASAIDRDALVAALAVPGLAPRATVLEPGLDNLRDPASPDWAAVPLTDRREQLQSAVQDLFGSDERPTIRIALPDGPGADMLFNRLSQDWGVLGFTVERVGKGESADLALVDRVAPSSSPAWFLRSFRCGVVPVCDSQVDEMLDGARDTAILAQRIALLDAASKRIDSLQLFIPITAPIRWSLVSPRITGFAGNRFAIHTLTGLEERLERTSE